MDYALGRLKWHPLCILYVHACHNPFGQTCSFGPHPSIIKSFLCTNYEALACEQVVFRCYQVLQGEPQNEVSSCNHCLIQVCICEAIMSRTSTAMCNIISHVLACHLTAMCKVMKRHVLIMSTFMKRPSCSIQVCERRLVLCWVSRNHPQWHVEDPHWHGPRSPTK